MYQGPKCPYSYFSKALVFNFRVFFSLWVSLSNINDSGDSNEKNKMFKNMGGNIPNGNFPEGNLMGGTFPGGSCPGRNFPDSVIFY